MFKKLLIIGGMIFILCLNVQNGFAQITLPYTVTSSMKGQTLTLTEDLQATYLMEKGISIMAHNFTLDGNGHSVTGMDQALGGDHTGLNPRDQYSGITIKNLIVTKWGDGIYARQYMHGLIDNCYLLDNASNGFSFANQPNTGTEIRNSIFEKNARFGIKVARTDSCYIHDNEILENERGGMTIEQLSTEYNIIEGNTIQDNMRFGMELYLAKHNLIKNNVLYNNKLIVEQADSNTFIGNTIEDSDTSLIAKSSIGNIFNDCKIINSRDFDVVMDLGAVVTFVGTEFNKDLVKIIDGASNLTVKWHLYVTISNSGAIEGAIIKIYDKDNNLVVEDTTNSEGKIETLDLVEYVQNSAGKVYSAPYQLEISKEGYPLINQTVDLIENTDLLISLTYVMNIQNGNLSQEFALFQNYPNPFNPTTAISYDLIRSSYVVIKIVDINGKLVRTLMKGFQAAGQKILHWNATDDQGKEVASGIYFYSLVAGDFKQTRRMVLVR